MIKHLKLKLRSYIIIKQTWRGFLPDDVFLSAEPALLISEDPEGLLKCLFKGTEYHIQYLE
jgi:hypothetical protein